MGKSADNRKYSDEYIAQVLFERQHLPTQVERLKGLYSESYIKRNYKDIVNENVLKLLNDMIEKTKEKVIASKADRLDHIGDTLDTGKSAEHRLKRIEEEENGREY